MSTNEQIIRDFISAWSRLDADELVSYFTEDGIYHNMPVDPVQGTDALRGFIKAFLGNWSKTDWEILTLVAHGDTVIAERMDRTIADGKNVNLPCVGIFEMRDGKIAEWRDYFDMGTYVNALAD